MAGASAPGIGSHGVAGKRLLGIAWSISVMTYNLIINDAVPHYTQGIYAIY